jgi:hypothetical protein
MIHFLASVTTPTARNNVMTEPNIIRSDPVLARLTRARALLASATGPVDCKPVADMAHVVEVFARRQGLSLKVRAQVHEIYVDALTEMGAFLEQGPKNEGTRGQLTSRGVVGGPKLEPPITPPTQEGLLGPGGKKIASVAQTLSWMRRTAPDLHEKVRRGLMKTSAACRQFRKASAAGPLVIPGQGDPRLLWPA